VSLVPNLERGNTPIRLHQRGKSVDEDQLKDFELTDSLSFFFQQILEDLVCPSVEVLPEPPVSNEVHQKRLGNDGESRVKRARQLLGLDKSLSTEIDELRPVDHTLSASLAKSAQLLSSRHLRIYFPASARY